MINILSSTILQIPTIQQVETIIQTIIPKSINILSNTVIKEELSNVTSIIIDSDNYLIKQTYENVITIPNETDDIQ